MMGKIVLNCWNYCLDKLQENHQISEQMLKTNRLSLHKYTYF